MDLAPIYEESLASRGIPDKLAIRHLEGSECCLAHTDNPLSRSKGVWLNPLVRVGYSGSAYDVANPTGWWLSTWKITKWSWQNRFSRWFTSVWFKEQVVRWRVSSWRKKPLKSDEKGVYCLIIEMQVLVSTWWKHL